MNNTKQRTAATRHLDVAPELLAKILAGLQVGDGQRCYKVRRGLPEDAELCGVELLGTPDARVVRIHLASNHFDRTIINTALPPVELHTSRVGATEEEAAALRAEVARLRRLVDAYACG